MECVVKTETSVNVRLVGLGPSVMRLVHREPMGRPVTACVVVRMEARVTL